MAVLVGLVALGWMWLRTYTRHDDKVRIPDLEGLALEEAAAMLEKRSLQAVVIDSVYRDDVSKGSVVDQDPDAGQEVKPERKIYLVLNASQPKMLNMPDLVNLSKRQAMSVLDIIGLKVKELEYRPDPCTDCVIEQRYRGEPIAPETRIRKGEAITLLLGAGERGQRVPVPDLRGFDLAEVRMLLNRASLNLGVVVACHGCNTSNDSVLARVERQSPAANVNNLIALGSMIDIWLNADTSGLRPAFDPADTTATPWNDPQ